MHKSASIIEKDINIPFLLSPQMIELNQKKHSISNKNNNILNKMHKTALFLKKINLKDNINKVYLDRINKIFYDENIFFDKYYKGKKIVVGKSHDKNHINLGIKSDKKNNIKRGSIISRGKELLNPNSTNTNITNKSNNNYTESFKQNSRNRRIIKKKDNYITDEDLKNIYKKFLDRENINNKGNINIKKDKMKKMRTFSAKEFDNILNLQNLILEKRKEVIKDKNKIEEKILRHTAKHRDKLLINQINDYRIKKEEIEEIDKNNEESNNYDNYLNSHNFIKKRNYLKSKDIDANLRWLTSLRDYQNNVKSLNNIKSQSLIKLNKRINSSNIFSSKEDKKYFNSFDKKEIIFNLTGNLDPIYAQIVLDNHKFNERIRDTLNDVPQNLKRKTLDNKMNKNNMYKGLNIKGKKLLNFEIELSKKLEGKKKRIIQFPYLENDLKNQLFAESLPFNKNDIPQSVKNTLELHYD